VPLVGFAGGRGRQVLRDREQRGLRHGRGVPGERTAAGASQFDGEHPDRGQFDGEGPGVVQPERRGPAEPAAVDVHQPARRLHVGFAAQREVDGSAPARRVDGGHAGRRPWTV
jgi:hypothetical protein